MWLPIWLILVRKPSIWPEGPPLAALAEGLVAEDITDY
jgi:hypothetical protein